MTHVKIMSVPTFWSTKHFFDGFTRAMQLSETEINKVKFVHVETHQNQSCHVRIAFYDSSIYQQLRARGKETNNSNVYSTTIYDKTMLYEIINNWTERFKLQPTSNHNNDNNIILMHLKIERVRARYRYTPPPMGV